MTKEKLNVGLVMPISAIDECDVQHWKSVKSMIERFLQEEFSDVYELEIKIVSERDTSHVIQFTIIENLLQSDLVIVDISCLNSNVMFEFGIRFALNKRLLILKDDQTKAPFDVNLIQYVPYPRNLENLTDFRDEFNRVLRGVMRDNKGLMSEFKLEKEWRNAVSNKDNKNTEKLITQRITANNTSLEQSVKKAIANYCIDYNTPLYALNYNNFLESHIQSNSFGFGMLDSKQKIACYEKAVQELRTFMFF
ncbi:hypothetical protein MKZ20_08105 [Psychrobacillus sp. FSL K6-2684]|uniref:hypothetical protein n=1 Tax=Psychrobacillus sp. FSL K6-2684 TaxID=2921547 RepID=UPI0030F8AB75